MNLWTSALAVILMFAAAAPAAEKAKASGPAAAPAKADPNLPRVLIIGDSISIGYTDPVRKRLDGKANVFRIPANGSHTGTGLEKLGEWLGKEKWDVIHFNWGLHDIVRWKTDDKGTKVRDKAAGTLAITPEDYGKNLTELVKRMKATGARLIWASTTPVPDGESGRVRGDEVKYNAIAEKIMKEQGVAVDDLYTAILPHVQEMAAGAGNVHFNAKGYDFLADRVAESILAALKAPAK
jgi:lysophospholipase L1-like esterase